MIENLKALLIMGMIYTPIFLHYFEIRKLKNRVMELEEKLSKKQD